MHKAKNIYFLLTKKKRDGSSQGVAQGRIPYLKIIFKILFLLIGISRVFGKIVGRNALSYLYGSQFGYCSVSVRSRRCLPRLRPTLRALSTLSRRHRSLQNNLPSHRTHSRGQA